MKYREILKMMALGYDKDTVDGLLSQAEEEEGVEDFVSAAFTICVSKRFEEDSSRAAIDRFIEEARRDFAGAQPPFKPLAAEAMVRVVADNDNSGHLLDEVDPADFIGVQIPLICKIVSESNELTERIDELMDNAEKVAAIWIEEKSQ